MEEEERRRKTQVLEVGARVRVWARWWAAASSRVEGRSWERGREENQPTTEELGLGLGLRRGEVGSTWPRGEKKGRGKGEEMKEVTVRERGEEAEEAVGSTSSVAAGEGREVTWPKRRPAAEAEEEEWRRREERVGPGIEIFEKGREGSVAMAERERETELGVRVNSLGGSRGFLLSLKLLGFFRKVGVVK